MSYPVNENRNSISYWKKYEQFKIKIKREKKQHFTYYCLRLKKQNINVADRISNIHI